MGRRILETVTDIAHSSFHKLLQFVNHTSRRVRGANYLPESEIVEIALHLISLRVDEPVHEILAITSKESMRFEDGWIHGNIFHAASPELFCDETDGRPS